MTIEVFELRGADAVPVTAPARRSRRARARARQAVGAIPALGSRLQMVRGVLVMICGLSAALLLQLVVISQFQQRATQQQQFDQLRSQLATGTAPIGPTGAGGEPLATGAPVAYLEIPEIGVHQVILEGTSSGTLFGGPGHRRDTPLPGQEGTSVVLGRRAAFGGPFSGLARLQTGDEITVTTGQGEFLFRVLGVRHEGDPSPPTLAEGAARMVLVTAEGAPYLPDGVLRVDADLVGEAAVGPERTVTATELPSEERIMGGDARTLWALALWLLAALGISLAAVWAWHRWGHARTWAVFVPPLLLVSLSASGEVARLLPNLL